MSVLISTVIALYVVGIHLAAPFNQKARLWVQGRCGLLQQLKSAIPEGTRPIWIHSASLGEYEQARPIIERIKKEFPDSKILVTFFSPSGYEIRKNDTLPDYIFYLPADTRRNVRQFLQIVQPRMAIFVKYEFWFNYMAGLHDREIPFYYISAIFRPSQYFFKPAGRWFARQLKKASCFFVQNEESEKLLKNIGIRQVEVCGDTRFDRVHAIARQPIALPFIASFQNGCKLIVAGSTWQPDEEVLAQVLSHLKGYKLVVAPHEIHRRNEVLRAFNRFKTIAYSEMEGKNLADYDVLVIDTIGILSKIYKYSTVSYIGGAFKTGLHNILEAAVYGVPLFFGPHYSKFNEAVTLVRRKGAFSITSANAMMEIVNHFETDTAYYAQTCAICRNYVSSNIGAVEKIVSALPLARA